MDDSSFSGLLLVLLLLLLLELFEVGATMLVMVILLFIGYCLCPIDEVGVGWMTGVEVVAGGEGEEGVRIGVLVAIFFMITT